MHEGSSFCNSEDQLFCYGGLSLTSQQVENSVTQISVKKDGVIERRSLTSTCPLASVFSCLFATDKELFLFFGSNQDVGYIEDMYRFTFSSSVWEKIVCEGHIPRPRDKQSTAVWNGKLFLFGGFGPIDEPQDSDEESDCKQKDKPECSNGPAVSDEADCEEEEEDESDSEEDNGEEEVPVCAVTMGWFNDLYTFDPDTVTWSNLPVRTGRLPSPRAAATLNIIPDKVGEKLVLFGGKTASARQNDLSIYPFHMSRWLTDIKVGGTPPCGRSFHSSCVVNDTSCGDDSPVASYLIISGGRDNDNKTLDDVFLLDLHVWQWNRVDMTLSLSRCCHAMIHAHDQLFVLGGVAGFNEEILLCTEQRDDEVIPMKKLFNAKICVPSVDNESDDAQDSVNGTEVNGSPASKKARLVTNGV